MSKPKHCMKSIDEENIVRYVKSLASLALAVFIVVLREGNSYEWLGAVDLLKNMDVFFLYLLRANEKRLGANKNFFRAVKNLHPAVGELSPCNHLRGGSGNIMQRSVDKKRCTEKQIRHTFYSHENGYTTKVTSL